MAVAWTGKVALLVAVFAVTTIVVIRWIGVDNNKSTSINFVSQDFFHEGADWDAENNRVLLSIFKLSGGGGGIVEVGLNGSEAGAILKAENVAAPKEAGGPTSVGIRVDSPRHRVLVVLTNPAKKDFSGLAAYDLSSWELLFQKDLAGPETASFGNDVAVDPEGNAYVTDSASPRIWKVSPDGSQSSVLTDSPLLKASGPLPFELVALNGIVYHPDGYLLVGHGSGGALFKVSLDGASIQRVTVSGSIVMADGITLLSNDIVLLTSPFGTKLVATSDGWETAKVTHKYSGPLYRMGTSVFVKDGKPYTSFALGSGMRKFHHTIREAVFRPI